MNTGERTMLDGTSRERTMLGGSNWKIIRTDRTLPMTLQNIQAAPDEPIANYEVHARRHGDDLGVSYQLFAAIEQAVDRDKPDRTDPDGINKEVRELGEMLTATQLPADHKRFVSIVSRLIVLYGKSDPGGICDNDSDTPNAEVHTPSESRMGHTDCPNIGCHANNERRCCAGAVCDAMKPNTAICPPAH